MSRDTEERIQAVAARQHGVVTRGQLMAAGLSSAAVQRRLRGNRLRPLHRGVYLVGPVVDRWTPEMAAALAAGPGALVSHISALPIWGLRAAAPRSGATTEPPPDLTAGAMNGALRLDQPVHVLVTGSQGRRPGLVAHRIATTASGVRAMRFGIPVTAPAHTILHVAGMLGTGELERIVARAEREGLVRPDALARLLSEHPGRSGAPALRRILRLPEGPQLTRSAPETRFLELTRQAGLPRPRANVRMGPYEIDFLWPDEKLAVEIDGFRHHSLRPRFEGDRDKDAWLLARGIRVMRISPRRLTRRPILVAARLAQALARP